MTLNGAFQGHPLKIQLVQKGWLLALAVVISLTMAFRRHNGIILAEVTTLAMVAVPLGYMLRRRMAEKLRQRDMEDRLMLNTRTYLHSEEPASTPKRRKETDIEILARAIDGRMLPIQDFRRFKGVASLVPVAYPVVFDALPRRYAIRSLYEKRLAELATMPAIVSVPLTELR
jgi:hypothetical protein